MMTKANEQSDLFGLADSNSETKTKPKSHLVSVGSTETREPYEPKFDDLLSQSSIAAATPSMSQFLTIRKKYPESYLLFYRMGDFYELFFQDAIRAARCLNITLTQRGTHLGQPIRMCGVPVVSAETYLQRLIQGGFRVVICEQLDEAKKGTALVRRGVVRLVTPGTITEDTLLDSERNHYILCLFSTSAAMFTLAWADVSTGAILTQSGDKYEAMATIERLCAAEIIVSDKWLADETSSKDFSLPRNALTPLAKDRFNITTARHVLLQHYRIPSLEIFGDFLDEELIAAGTLLDYITTTQAGIEGQMQPLKRSKASDYMMLSSEALRSLDILGQSTGRNQTPSLISYATLCLTAAGSRRACEWILHPLLKKQEIEARHDVISYFLDNPLVAETLRKRFKNMADGERALTRLLLQRGNPRDLASLGGLLLATARIREILQSAHTTHDTLPKLCQDLLEYLDPCDSLCDELNKAINDSLPTHVRHGGVIAPGYSQQLDQLHEAKNECARLIHKLAAQYKKETGIERLSINRNNMIGCYIEIPQRFADQISSTFHHKQSTSQALRFHTDELSHIDQDATRATNRAVQLEQELFAHLVDKVSQHQGKLRTTCAALSQLDVLLAWCQLAERDSLCRPKILDEPILSVKQARHPLVEHYVMNQGDSYIANDLELNKEHPVILLTGPNMAGKSTYLRQAALLCILAQSGCFVPAVEANIGLTDRIMTRIGAADDISRGKSTFMVEMMEAAAILHQATPRSLLILDELGRGTSTYDGLSLAWALLAHLHSKIRCRTLFSTHYQEITQLAERTKGINNYHMQCSVEGDTIRFLHAIKEGHAEQSYGHLVAYLAGIPAEIITHAREIQSQFQHHSPGRKHEKSIDAKANSEIVINKKAEILINMIRNTPPDSITPRQAMELLYDLHKLAQ